MSWIIADLIDYVNDVKPSNWDATYRRVLFPEPALRWRIRSIQVQRHCLGEHTLPMDPQEGPSRFPFRRYVALQEPGCSSFMASLANEVMVCRRVWRREPKSDISLKLITCRQFWSQVPGEKDGVRAQQTFYLVDLKYHLMKGNCRRKWEAKIPFCTDAPTQSLSDILLRRIAI